MLEKLFLEMIAYYSGDPKRIRHFTKVHSYAKLIGEREQLSPEELYILEAAAYTHDIGIKPAEEKYGSSEGKLQEQEGSAVAAQMRSATPLHQILSQQQMVSSFHCNTSHYCAACGFTRRGLSRTIRKAITASRFVNKPKIIQRDLFMPSFTALL